MVVPYNKHYMLFLKWNAWWTRDDNKIVTKEGLHLVWKYQHGDLMQPLKQKIIIGWHIRALRIRKRFFYTHLLSLPGYCCVYSTLYFLANNMKAFIGLFAFTWEFLLYNADFFLLEGTVNLGYDLDNSSKELNFFLVYIIKIIIQYKFILLHCPFDLHLLVACISYFHLYISQAN